MDSCETLGVPRSMAGKASRQQTSCGEDDIGERHLRLRGERHSCGSQQPPTPRTPGLRCQEPQPQPRGQRSIGEGLASHPQTKLRDKEAIIETMLGLLWAKSCKYRLCSPTNRGLKVSRSACLGVDIVAWNARRCPPILLEIRCCAR